MSNDLLKLPPDISNNEISLSTNDHGSAFISIKDNNYDEMCRYILEPTKDGIKAAKEIIKALTSWIAITKETENIK